MLENPNIITEARILVCVSAIIALLCELPFLASPDNIVVRRLLWVENHLTVSGRVSWFAHITNDSLRCADRDPVSWFDVRSVGHIRLLQTTVNLGGDCSAHVAADRRSRNRHQGQA